MSVDQTANYGFPRPHPVNYQDDDVVSLRAAMDAIDLVIRDLSIALQQGLMTRAQLEHSHALVSSESAGMMSPELLSKLVGIAIGATKNDSDAALRRRDLHTGTQGVDTIDGLDDVLANTQSKLVSGDSIKTVGGSTLLGPGNVPVQLIETVVNLITSNTTAVAGRIYDANTSGGGFTLTLPATPTIGMRVGVRDYQRTFPTNPLIIHGNGRLIEGYNDQLSLDAIFRGAFEFRGGTLGWAVA